MFEFRLPDVGEGLTEGEIVKWHVREGEAVKQDQVLLELETDKAIVEIPSPRTGTIAKLSHKEGDTVKVGEVLVVIAEAGDKMSVVQQAVAAPVPKQEAPKIESTPRTPTVPVSEEHYSSSVVGQLEEAPEDVITTTQARRAMDAPKQVPSAHSQATPAVRRLARDLHVNLENVAGTGHENRITEEDVRKAAESHGVEEVQPAVHVSKKFDFYGYVDHVPLKGVRKATAEHLKKSFTTAVHVTHMDEADVTELFQIREKEKETAKKRGTHLTFLPFIVKACISALKDHPLLNASIDDEHQEIILKKYYNIGIATDTPDGLIVPVVKNAQNKKILDIAKEIEDLADRAQSRKLDLGDMKGQSFTITNIGVLGGMFATPTINWPDVAILGLGRIYDKVVYKDEKIQVRKHLPFSVTFDHRALDGAECARFANDFKNQLEDPDMLLME